MSKQLSLLCPDREEKLHKLSQTAIHDLGMDSIIGKLSDKPKEREYIRNVMRFLPADPHTVQYRCDVFDDLHHNLSVRKKLLEILDQIDFMKDYITHDLDSDAGAFDLLDRMCDIGEYIQCIEAIYSCFKDADIHSEGLLALRDYVTRLYTDNGFAGMKKDIDGLRADTSNLRSVTLGVNLNQSFKAESVGVISLNDRPFTKAGIVSNFVSQMAARDDQLQHGTDWNENYTYQPIDAGSEAAKKDLRAAVVPPIALATLMTVPENEESIRSLPDYMNDIANRMLKRTVRHLRSVLNKYSMVTVTSITSLMPELIYYVRWAEYIEKLEAEGYHFAKPEVSNSAMDARGIYNLKLAALDNCRVSDIVTNDLDFLPEHRIYILTGANRGGKTTITQAVGQLYFLAQGGISVPADSFHFQPVDGIFTHFPADEDKTMELGRLGEECRRFRSIFEGATERSLLLLNETFSTTSFEEGYYIARDAVRAMLHKGCRVIYNTHMHKLAREIDEINREYAEDTPPAAAASSAGAEALPHRAASSADADVSPYRAASLVVESEEGVRSYRVKLAPPEGLSHASDIAKKYGVTYEDLVRC